MYTYSPHTIHNNTPHTHTHTHTHSLSCLEWLVDHAEGDPYMMAADGMAPVHAAAQAGQIACLQWLVERAGVPIRFRADDGATPAHFAAASGEVRWRWEGGRERGRGGDERQEEGEMCKNDTLAIELCGSAEGSACTGNALTQTISPRLSSVPLLRSHLWPLSLLSVFTVVTI